MFVLDVRTNCTQHETSMLVIMKESRKLACEGPNTENQILSFKLQILKIKSKYHLSNFKL